MSTCVQVAFHPSDRNLVASGSKDRSARLWDCSTGEAIMAMYVVARNSRRAARTGGPAVAPLAAAHSCCRRLPPAPALAPAWRPQRRWWR